MGGAPAFNHFLRFSELSLSLFHSVLSLIFRSYRLDFVIFCNPHHNLPHNLTITHHVFSAFSINASSRSSPRSHIISATASNSSPHVTANCFTHKQHVDFRATISFPYQCGCPGEHQVHSGRIPILVASTRDPQHDLPPHIHPCKRRDLLENSQRLGWKSFARSAEQLFPLSFACDTDTHDMSRRI
jgi:hypothetical protein